MKLEGQTTYKEALGRMMKRPGFKEAYDALEPKFAIYDVLMEARIKKNLTQKELAEKIGVTQSALARFESGTGNPTISSVQKIAGALGLKVQIVPA